MNALVFNKPVKKFTPSVEQKNFFDWIMNGQGSVILSAVAGGGKTSTLCEAIRIMNGSIFFGAFSKKIADELKTRVGHLGKANISTFHAFGMQQWRRVADKCLSVDSDKCRNIFRDRNWKDIESRILESSTLQLVSIAKQAGLGITSAINDRTLWNQMIDHFGVETVNENKQKDNRELIITLAIEVYTESLNQCMKIIDFDDMILAPLFFGVSIDKFDWVLIDEAQDTNCVRRIMSERMMHETSRLVAVGDPHQAIFGFTGADADSLDLIAKMANAPYMPLSFSFRCPKSVVAHAHQWVSHIQATPEAHEGLVKEINLAEMTTKIEVGDLMVSRFNAPLMSQAYALIMVGKPARIEGKEIGAGLKLLVNRWKVRTLDALLARLEQYLVREVKKHTERDNKIGIENVTDKVECCRIIIERVRMQNPNGTQKDVGAEIDRLFGTDPKDPANRKPAVVLSSIHSAKGLEYPRVFWLQLGKSPWARKKWEVEQEDNLCYVATTRAMNELYLVEMPKKQ